MMNYKNYPKSMNNFGITAVEAVGLTIPDNLSNDPVTKAVYDNILGNIPAKKKDQYSCALCKLQFSSKAILNAHLAGSKHQKKLKAQETLKSLARTDPTCGKDFSTGQLRCSLCNMTFMAAHCLKRHSLTREHRIKKGEDVGDEEDPPVEMNGAPTAIDPATGVPIKKKERPRVAVSVPDCVTKTEDTRAGGKYFCNPCQATCNSDIQLQQHLSCKKHLEKVSGRKTTAINRWKGSGSVYGKARGKGRNTGSASSRWENSLSNSSALLINTITSNYNQAYPDSSLSSYTDSYGLSSLGRSSVQDYGVGKSVAGVRGGNRGAATAAYGQSEMYGVTEGDYGRGTPVYGKPEAYPRTAEYSTDYHHGKASDYNYSSYTGSSAAAAAAYAAQGYSTGQSVAPRPAARSATSMYATYAQPLTQNFVSGGKIY